jgi:protein-tyrosine phosphatase
MKNPLSPHRLLATLAAAAGLASVSLAGIGLLAPAAGATESSGVIPFTAANVAQQPSGTYDITWSAPSAAGPVSVYAGSSALTPATTHLVGHGGDRGSIAVTSLAAADPRWYFTLTPAHGTPLVIADRSLHLVDAPNFRDVGGVRTSSGQWIRMGILYRSGSLNNLTTAEDNEMTALGINHVVDLRTAAERAATVDKLAPGIDYVVDDVLAGNPTLSNITAAATALISGSNKSSATVAQAEGILTGLYKALPVLDTAKTGYSQLFTSAATLPSGEALVFHCTAGKDRTGWATAALELELGVPMSTVDADYLDSNRYVLPEYKPVVASYVAQGGKAKVIDTVLGVQPLYLNTSLKVMDSAYGSVNAYFSKGLGLSPATVGALRHALLEGSPN